MKVWIEMGFFWVQTWTVLNGKFEEHDELMKKWIQYGSSKYGKKSRLFQQRYGPIGARVLIAEFKDDDEFHSFWDKVNTDEKFVNFRSKWYELIDTASWRAVFWDETALE